MNLEEEKDHLNDIETTEETFSTEVKNEFETNLNKSTKSLLHCNTVSEENFIVKKENQCYAEHKRMGNFEGAKDSVASNTENFQTSFHQLVWNSNHNTSLKENMCSHSEISESSNLFDDLTLDIFQSSSSTDPSTTKYNSNTNLKNDIEELNLISTPENTPSPIPSKQKLRSTKRRAGIFYKQVTSSKLHKVTSEYFSQAHNKSKKRWIPPRSPYALVQEDLFDNPWQLLIATIFLTKTTAKKALPYLHKFLARYPRPEDVLKANYEDIDEYFKPLGLTTTRSHIIMRFTVEFIEKNWTYPRELYGIGKYGDDSYRMFCINEWRQVSPDDIPLTMYRNWLLENAERLGIE